MEKINKKCVLGLLLLVIMGRISAEIQISFDNDDNNAGTENDDYYLTVEAPVQQEPSFLRMAEQAEEQRRFAEQRKFAQIMYSTYVMIQKLHERYIDGGSSDEALRAEIEKLVVQYKALKKIADQNIE